MPNDPFMLVSLKESQAKKLSHVLANPTSTKILEYLAGKDATESQISKDLGVPLSTVHYNMKQLVDAKLVVSDEFHYSSRGKEVSHYKLANKYIIIAPKEESDGFLQHLRKFVPAAIITVGVGVVLKSLQFFTGTSSSAKLQTPEIAMMRTADTADTMAAGLAMEAPPEPTCFNCDVWWQSPMIDYFLLGAVFVLAVLIISEAVSYWRYKR